MSLSNDDMEAISDIGGEFAPADNGGMGTATFDENFEFDSSEVSSEMRSTIERNYDCLAKSGGPVVLYGHCDDQGTTEYNMALGERRAGIVAKVIRTLGLDDSRVRAVSKGEEEATGTDEASRAKDRRVEFE